MQLQKFFDTTVLTINYLPKCPSMINEFSLALNYFVPDLKGYASCQSKASHHEQNVYIFKYIVPSSIFPGSNGIFSADKAAPDLKEPDFVITPLDSQHCFVSILLPDCFTSAYSIRDMLLCHN